ncbi:MAG: ribonuclease BN [Bacteroidetes bacterium HGW-Bacteroidetes-11]|jgi:membrane protein|nr:MAG: ribonuclease BN [Bacteroidetes bacterium HGW-Bacteroidetes-11]
MKQKLKDIGLLFKIAFKKWWARNPFRESAVIAYYAIFSLPGLLVVIMTVAGYFLGNDNATRHLESQISSILGAETAVQVQDMIKKASELKPSIWAAILGIGTILIGATGVFVQFQKSLNIIWEVKADESKSGIWSLVRARLFSFGLILTIAFILMISLVVSSILMAIGNWLANQISDTFVIIIRAINFIMSLLINALLFALMFKYYPDAKIRWKHVWLGSIITSLLFFLGMFGLSIYFGKAEPGSGYGAAGSIILILLWVSYSSMIVFYGAEFTHAYAELYEGKIAPDKNAVEHHENETKQEPSNPKS